jgi:hypothetical protein
MRTHRRFQPTLDCMPTRIAPSGLAIIAPVIGAETNPPPPPVTATISPIMCSTDPTDPIDPPAA